MMATTSGQLLEGGEENLPPLSPNVEASQLLTPLQLERITIDNPHYRDHLTHTMAYQAMLSPAVPNHQHVLHRRTARLGDSYFFLQKDIPIAQSYARTTLKLSEVRPSDQIVDRPLYSQKVIGKEVHLPFPQEHPYTSHISRFAVFPDTKHQQPPPDTNIPKSHEQAKSEAADKTVPKDGLAQPNTASTHTQTTLTCFTSSLKPLPAYYIHQKASEWGQRVEEHHLSVPGMPSLNTNVGRTFWDLPRSRQHRRANTYPAPRVLYSAQLPETTPIATSPHDKQHNHQSTTTQFVATPPSLLAATPTSLPATTPPPPPITPRTNDALNTIHRMLTRTTTYAEHFPRHLQSVSGNQNVLRVDYSLRSCVSHRPWTNESRGKYCRRIPLSAPRVEDSERDDSSEIDYDALGASDGIVFSLLKGSNNSPKKEEEGRETEKNEGTHCKGVDIDVNKSEVCTNGSDATCRSCKGNPPRDSNSSKQITSKDRNQNSEQRQANTAENSKVVMVDSSTQTEENYFNNTIPNGVPQPLPQVRSTNIAQLQASATSHVLQGAQELSKLPQVAEYRQLQTAPSVAGAKGGAVLPSETSKYLQPPIRSLDMSRQPPRLPDASPLVKYPLAKRPLSAFMESLSPYNASQKSTHLRSFSADASLCSSTAQVCTGEVTRRLMGLYNGFSRTEVMKKFHEQYPERAPDLREYSIREGKRHVIHGSHAYYFH